MERRNTVQKDLVRNAVLTMKRHVSEEGSIRRIEVPNGPDRFDFTLRNHYHGRCVRCGEVFDVDMDEIPGLIERIRDPHGMQFLSYDIMFKAICPACQMQE